MKNQDGFDSREDNSCGKEFAFESKACARVSGHLGLHRDTKTVRKAAVQWGDNECKTGDR